MWDLWIMLSRIIEPVVVEMYCSAMMNCVIVFELLLVDFETIPTERWLFLPRFIRCVVERA